MSAGDDARSRRLDKWLWCARRFKTRSLAAKFIVEESVRVTRNGVTHRTDKASFQLRGGDEISYMLGERLFVLTVTGFAERRGSPAAASVLFVDQGHVQPADTPPCKAAG